MNQKNCIKVEDMNYDCFSERLLEELKAEFGNGYTIEIHEIMKNNAQKMDCIVIYNNESLVTPNFYIKKLYEEYQKGESLSGVVEEICNAYQMAIQKNPYPSLDFSYENCRDRVVFRLVSKEKNQEILNTVPHIPFLDLAVVFYIVVKSTSMGLSSVRITNQIMEQWKKTPHDLFHIAKKNTKKMFPVRMEPMTELLKELLGCSQDPELYQFIEENAGRDEDMIYVITNEAGINGASSILFGSALQKTAEVIGGDYYLLPSSIHEVLALSKDTSIDFEQLKHMVSAVNEECVEPTEVLSDKVYFYDHLDKKISICMG